jgi:hypothetical protein
MEARGLRQHIDPSLVLGVLADNPAALKAFKEGMEDALFLEDLHENTDHSEIEHLKNEVQDYGMCEHSPLVLDLDNNGFTMAPVKDGVFFDLLSRDRAVKSSWPTGGDALLVFDRNGDGAITSGNELFGNTQDASNGFERLAELDLVVNGGNADGVIDASDAGFAQMNIWRDANHDGQSDASELSSLAEVGIASIELSYVETDFRDVYGNHLRQQGSFVIEKDGVCQRQSIADIWFRYTTLR